MANPNIVNVATINGNVAGQAVATSMTAIITNASASGKIYKINSLVVANVDGTNNATISADVVISGTSYAIAHTIVVPADSSIVLIGKDSPIYLTENSSLQLQANAASDLEAVASWDEIS